ncbi:MAG: hypothetical protein IMZ62_11165 [Chloroflexi bacterium]|nr:hypothetical protein [Chloroflexota bacterium]
MVIDASVAVCKYPSGKCRRFLQAVLDICHRVVMTEAIRREWYDHAPDHSMKWLLAMGRKGKVVFLKDDAIRPHEHMDKKTRATLPAEKGRRAVAKDMHLLAAALATDNTVVSRDKEVRELLREAVREAPRFRKIVWVNPHEEDDSMKWLEEGAKPERSRMLGQA